MFVLAAVNNGVWRNFRGMLVIPQTDRHAHADRETAGLNESLCVPRQRRVSRRSVRVCGLWLTGRKSRGAGNSTEATVADQSCSVHHHHLLSTSLSCLSSSVSLSLSLSSSLSLARAPSSPRSSLI